MMEAAENTALDIQYMLPSCVPATPFENAGATVEALQMGEPIKREKILGLGEFMNFPGVLSTDDSVLDKLLLAKKEGKLIDGHSPGLSGLALNGYAAARIQGDHECAAVEDMQERIACGMYVLLRQGSACHDLRTRYAGKQPQMPALFGRPPAKDDFAGGASGQPPADLCGGGAGRGDRASHGDSECR